MAFQGPPVLDSAADGPDLAARAGIGFYAGVLVAGVVTVVSVAAGLETATVLVTVPSTLVAVLLLALVLGDRLGTLPVRLGRNRRRRALPFVPAVGFALLPVAPAVTGLGSTTRLTVAAAVFALLTAAVALGVAGLCRNRYVEAVTDDEPIVSWTWRKPADDGWQIVVAVGAALVLVGGIGSLVAGSRTGIWFVLYGSVALLFWVAERRDWDVWWLAVVDEEYDAPSAETALEAHEAGLVVDRFEQKLIPWDRLTDVRLTDEELVLERRLRSIRCDREAIDDLESVLEGIERARSRPDSRLVH